MQRVGCQQERDQQDDDAIGEECLPEELGVDASPIALRQCLGETE